MNETNDAIMRETLRKLQQKILPTEQESEAVFTCIMQGQATPAQIGALLLGLSILGETPEIVAGAARAMRAAATKIRPKTTGLLDTCGTGGDGASTFNISTTVAIVAAAAGQPVAKHGNRAISSRSGSADVLEALGVRLDLSPEQVAACIDATGIGFLFAPAHHPAMKHAASPRRELGIRSVFNLLGPLTNPACAAYQIIGVYAADRMNLVAGALAKLGIRRALVVHGQDGLDEITTTTMTDAVQVEDGRKSERFELDPDAFGIPRATPEALAGGDATHNAAIIQHVLAGQKGAARDIVLFNTAAALWLTQKADGIADGLAMAADAIDSGKAKDKLAALIEFTHNPPAA